MTHAAQHGGFFCVLCDRRIGQDKRFRFHIEAKHKAKDQVKGENVRCTPEYKQQCLEYRLRTCGGNDTLKGKQQLIDLRKQFPLKAPCCSLHTRQRVEEKGNLEFYHADFRNVFIHKHKWPKNQ